MHWTALVLTTVLDTVLYCLLDLSSFPLWPQQCHLQSLSCILHLPPSMLDVRKVVLLSCCCFFISCVFVLRYLFYSYENQELLMLALMRPLLAKPGCLLP